MVSHGNGPQVGFILRRSEMSQDEVDPVPVDYAVADTQGAIGYMFVKALTNELHAPRTDASGRRRRHPVARRSRRSGFRAPDQADRLVPDRGQGARDGRVARLDDQGRRGPRLAPSVPSPRPQRIVETEVIRALLDSGAVVVAAGGGGIPVAIQPDGTARRRGGRRRQGPRLRLLAQHLGADMLLIPTAVPRVAIRFGKPDQRWLDTITVDEARAYIECGRVRRRQHGAESGSGC